MNIVTIEKQIELFKGCQQQADRPNRVDMPDGSWCDAKRFNVVFGGLVFELRNELKPTKSAWQAFLYNFRLQSPQ